MENKILEVIKSSIKPLKPGEIAQLAGIDAKEVDKSLKKLKAAEKIYSPVRCYYDIKK